MRYYESLYIVNPNYEQNRLDEVMKTISDKISEYGFKTINHFVWGKKRLAYNIQEHKYGSYVLLHFETESLENLERFERFMVLQKTILRNQTVLLDDKPEKQSEKSESSTESVDKKEADPKSPKQDSNPEKNKKSEESAEADETPEPEQSEESAEADETPEPEQPEESAETEMKEEK